MTDDRSARATRASHANGASRRSGERESVSGSPRGEAPRMRLDVLLDVACLFKTRSEAKKACEGGKVDVNGQASKPHRDIKIGDELDITHPFGRHQDIV